MSTITHARSVREGDDESAVRAALAALADALRGRDAAAVARSFAPDARLAGLAPPLLQESFDAAELQVWLDGWDGPVETEPHDLRLRISGDLAVAHGLQRTSARRKGEAAAWWSRITLALERGKDGWRIFHLHESVPFHMDGSMRAALDLEP